MNRSAENFSPSETDKFTGYVGKRINRIQKNNPDDIKYQLIEDRCASVLLLALFGRFHTAFSQQRGYSY